MKVFLERRFFVRKCAKCKGRAKKPTLTVYVTVKDGNDKARGFYCSKHAPVVGSFIRNPEEIRLWGGAK